MWIREKVSRLTLLEPNEAIRGHVFLIRCPWHVLLLQEIHDSRNTVRQSQDTCQMLRPHHDFYESHSLAGDSMHVVVRHTKVITACNRYIVWLRRVCNAKRLIQEDALLNKLLECRLTNRTNDVDQYAVQDDRDGLRWQTRSRSRCSHKRSKESGV